MASFDMIEINLLPEELKAKPKERKTKLEPKAVFYLAPVIFALLIATHIYLAVVNIKNSYQLKALNNKWQAQEPQRKILDSAKEEYDILSADVQAIRQLAAERINWAEKLNQISLGLPSGVWLNEISLAGNKFNLNGSAISLQKQEMSLINKFLTNLKNDPDFFHGFNSLDLDSVQKRAVGGYEIADFIFRGSLK
ncbi:MAG: PilN domain-containing protein [Candidatus Omnitrophica bacterium]|nr:PilN domain-containing protein [Candidatus Omnitrophota bacterium]MBI5144947.1 PilN domain-containing protein [Candidatus Omnitrophota bacterium]